MRCLGWSLAALALGVLVVSGLLYVGGVPLGSPLLAFAAVLALGLLRDYRLRHHH